MMVTSGHEERASRLNILTARASSVNAGEIGRSRALLGEETAPGEPLTGWRKWRIAGLAFSDYLAECHSEPAPDDPFSDVSAR